jgi:ribokinase
MDTDRLPVGGQTLIGSNYHVTHGGKGSNMACCASRLGARSNFMGKLGRDAFGEGFLKLLSSEHVNTEGVLYSELPTAVGFIVCCRDGSNMIVIDRGANADFRPADVLARRNLVEASDVVLSPLEIPLETALAAAALAGTRGIPAILNPAPAVDLRGVDLSGVFALTPNEGEARLCLGRPVEDPASPEELAGALLDLGVKNVILTLGPQGVLWASARGLCHMPALPVEVVDTVGAGDAFNAGLAVGLSERRPLVEAIALGVTAASLSTRKRETIDSYPYRQEVDFRVPELQPWMLVC